MKKSKLKKFAVALLTVVIGFAAGIGIGALMVRGSGGVPSLLKFGLLLLLFYLALFLQLILHEGGHMVCGLATGYKFVSFRVGSLILIRRDGKFRLKRFALAGTGGQCLLAPPPLEDGRMPVQLYMMGGVLSNLLFGLLALAILLCTDAEGLWFGFLAGMAAIGLLFALLNGLPLSVNVPNDGMNALVIRRNPQAAHALWNQLTLNNAISEGVRLRDMPEEWFAPLEGNDLLTASQAVFRANRLMDAHNFAAAGELMRQILEEPGRIPPIYLNMLALDLSLLEMLGENRKETVDSLLNGEVQQQMKAMKTNPSVIRTQYAVALLQQKDEKKAADWLAAFEKAAKKHPYAGEIEGERELIALVQEKAAEVKGMAEK